MIDIEKLTSRDIILEGVYTSIPTLMTTVTGSNIFPTKVVETETVSIPDISIPIYQVDGRWVYGSKVQTFYTHAGGEIPLKVRWYAFKQALIPAEVKTKVAPETQKASEVELLSNLKNTIALGKEIDFHALSTNTANYATGYHATPAVKWDAASNTTIVKDIETGIQALIDRGIKPTTIIMPLKVWHKIKFATELKNMYVDRNYATPAFLKDLFEIPNIIMPAVSTYGKPKKGVSVATDLWGDDVIITSNQPLGAGTYPAFIKASLQPQLIQRMPFDEEEMTQTIIAREAVGFNFIKNNAAYLIKNTLS